MFFASANSDAAAAGVGALGLVFIVILGVLGLVVYFVPTIIAVMRHHSSVGAIVALNVLLGWSFVGWVVSLVWSLSSDGRNQPVQQMGINFYGGAPGPYAPNAQPTYQQNAQPTYQPAYPAADQAYVAADTKQCEHCHSMIPAGAGVCRFCQRAVGASSMNPPAPLV